MMNMLTNTTTRSTTKAAGLEFLLIQYNYILAYFNSIIFFILVKSPARIV